MATVYVPAPVQDAGQAYESTAIARAPDTGGAAPAPISATTARPIVG